MADPDRPAPIRVRINGEDRDIPAGLTVEALLAHLALPAERVAVERNGDIVARAARGATALEGGDRLEIVHFVGGG